MVSASRILLCLLLFVLPGEHHLEGQVTTGTPDTTRLVGDPGDIASVARAAQALFERRRLRHLPLSLGSTGGSCDEHVGRFCTWYGEGEWFPVPEPDEILRLRSELLASLDSLQTLAPGDGWIRSQRVWYRAEGDDWPAALEASRECTVGNDWWCAALEGFALHGLGRYVEAESAFQAALDGMGEGRAREWRVPGWAADSDLEDLLEDVEYDPSGESELLARVWHLADPLYLVDGNDRLTAHYARWTVATLRDRARNPFHISWGRDLDELTVRHGWELGWERSASRSFTSVENVIGHKHPEGRDYLPSGRALQDPVAASVEVLSPGKVRPRSLYAPRYAPVLLPMEGQLAVFPRGTRMAIVATSFLPEDHAIRRRRFDRAGIGREGRRRGDDRGPARFVRRLVRELEPGAKASRSITARHCGATSTRGYRDALRHSPVACCIPDATHTRGGAREGAAAARGAARGALCDWMGDRRTRLPARDLPVRGLCRAHRSKHNRKGRGLSPSVAPSQAARPLVGGAGS